MKVLILIFTGLLLGGCAVVPSMKSVDGVYEQKEGENAYRAALLENGIAEGYRNGKKIGREGKWKLTKEGEIHVTYSDGEVSIYRINKDCSITFIAAIYLDGERISAPKEAQVNFKKIK